MDSGTDFLQGYKQVQFMAGRGAEVSASRDLASWREFVAACAEGYDDVLPEYFHDLRVRDAIERGLANHSLMGMRGFADFSRAVHIVDERFREIATVRIVLADPEMFSWWHHVVPGRGSEEFARDLQLHFGVTIEIV
ncbi:hypothetical protein [Streptomyces deccanensis]|uniref:hypothetical protein n=1 Tax=Streptomyces deccanensis TaxID=424188 RepID=UPI001EFBCAE3|nr:hypothetical protein [Streptomyces deccanensis]ULR52980.1 hypothetical protein L3078_28940 [Streptomyces deccanensis]